MKRVIFKTINFDNLKLFYVVEDSLKKYLLSMKGEQTFGEDGSDDFSLKPMQDNGVSNGVYRIKVKWIKSPEEGIIWQNFGTLQIALDKKITDEVTESSNYAWIEVDNKVFYTPFYTSKKSASILGFVGFIANILNLHPRGVTRCEIALDTDKTELVKRNLKAMKKFHTIAMGREHLPTDKATDTFLITTGTYDNLLKEKNIYVKSTNYELKIYNKSKEIEDVSEKYYISNLWKSPKTHYRVEITFNNGKAVYQWLKANNLNFEDFYYQAICCGNEQMIQDLFSEYLFRCLHYRTDNGQLLGVLDVTR